MCDVIVGLHGVANKPGLLGRLISVRICAFRTGESAGICSAEPAGTFMPGEDRTSAAPLSATKYVARLPSSAKRTAVCSVRFSNTLSRNPSSEKARRPRIPGESSSPESLFPATLSSDRSFRASCTIPLPILLRPSAHPNDNALKQIVLIFRGMPWLRSAISLMADEVKISGPS